jgi:hypothetical protein
MEPLRGTRFFYSPAASPRSFALDDTTGPASFLTPAPWPAAAAALDCGGLPPLSFRLTEELRKDWTNHPCRRLRMG